MKTFYLAPAVAYKVRARSLKEARLAVALYALWADRNRLKNCGRKYYERVGRANQRTLSV